MRSGSFKRNHGSKKGVFRLFMGNQRSLYGEEPRPGLGPESMNDSGRWWEERRIFQEGTAARIKTDSPGTSREKYFPFDKTRKMRCKEAAGTLKSPPYQHPH